MICFALVFLLVGGLLPALLPGRTGDQPPPKTALHRICKVLYWLPQYCLPRGTHDGIKIPLGVLSVLLWGLVLGFILNIVWRGPADFLRKPWCREGGK